jgi:hypothetical protein
MAEIIGWTKIPYRRKEVYRGGAKMEDLLEAVVISTVAVLERFDQERVSRVQTVVR